MCVLAGVASIIALLMKKIPEASLNQHGTRVSRVALIVDTLESYGRIIDQLSSWN